MTDEAVSPLRRRMIEDMTIREFTAKTQHDYVQRIKNFAAFLSRSRSPISSQTRRKSTKLRSTSLARSDSGIFTASMA